ncbi:hypothetical protein DFH27DRAFT_233996 [Peziza echinospora]|nr:hypothetical protein DFH27DRAFT_233996 [Peziza echinospora]
MGPEANLGYHVGNSVWPCGLVCIYPAFKFHGPHHWSSFSCSLPKRHQCGRLMSCRNSYSPSIDLASLALLSFVLNFIYLL